MGAIASAIYAGFKWLTWWRARDLAARAGRGRSVGYLLLWPGMDARAFLGSGARPAKPAPTEWAFAGAKTICGAWLLAGGLARIIPRDALLVAGWTGLLAGLLVLHFGCFHLVALAWRAAGVDARPIMCAPALATSLADFWGNRWNLAFRQLAYDLVVVPLRRRLGVSGAGFAAFLVSGLVHEVVISLPAGGGFGLPTAYFVLQGLGVLFERSRIGRRLGLGRGFRGWFFALAVTAGPLPSLFHRPFTTRVVLPLLHAAGAL